MAAGSPAPRRSTSIPTSKMSTSPSIQRASSMSENPIVLAVIPARGGSKRLPRKNILPLAGYPVIAYTIKAAQGAERLTHWLVSTDDEEIAAVARDYGAPVPFLRPAALAGDTA